MKALGLILVISVLCAACTTSSSSVPVGTPVDRYGGPPMESPFDLDRAEAGVTVIAGGFPPGRQPDGNTVILDTRDGLIVFDTGRHRFHTQKIIDHAAAAKRPVVAIINSHWHLDHVSGNIPLRAQFPAAVIYNHGAALANARATFLATGRASNRKLLDDPATTPEIIDEIHIDAATIDQGEKLLPTVSVEGDRTLTIGGRRLDLHVAKGASDGDIWLYDPAAKLVMTGDLITFPAPFLDTPCPKAWSEGLDAVLATPFVRAVPGHGRDLTRAEVILYRDAFNALIDCAKGQAEPIACAEAWAAAAAPMQENPENDFKYARGMSRNYVENVLRKDGIRKDCSA